MKFTVGVLFILLASSFNNNGENKKPNNESSFVFDIKKYESKFRYKNLNEFKINDTTIQGLKEVNEADLKLISQNEELFSGYYNHQFFYYSIQSKVKKNSFTIISIPDKSETDHFPSCIWYLSYSPKGKLIKTIQLEKGPDRIYGYESYVNDSTYKVAAVQFSFDKKIDSNNQIETHIITNIYTLHLDLEGNIYHISYDDQEEQIKTKN